MYAALVLSQSMQLYQLKCGYASTVCFTQCRRRRQMVILSDVPSATFLLPCYYRVMSIDINLLERSISFSLNPILVSEMQLLQSLISKELLNNSWLCQMCWYIFPVVAQKFGSPCLSSQERLWTLHCNFQKSLLILGSLNSDADGDARTEAVKEGTMLCAFAHEKQSILSRMPTTHRHPKSAPAFEKLCFICAFSYASFRRVWESWISAGLSQKFSGISAREPVLLFLVPQWIEVTFPTREGLAVTFKTSQTGKYIQLC